MGLKGVVNPARRDADAVAVIVEAFAVEFPTPADAASLRRERQYRGVSFWLRSPRHGRFRLGDYQLTVFPLRERPEDIPLLVSFFVTALAKKLGKPLEGFSRKAMEQLMTYAWPGNVRELQNIVERAAILAQTPVLEVESHLLGQSAGDAPPAVLGTLPDPSAEGPPSLEQLERAYIIDVLRTTRGVVEGPRGAASILDLHPNTLRSRIKKLGIRRSDYDIS